MTVLLADDQPIALSGLQALLAPAGLRFLTAGTPEQALRAVEDHLPRLVISGFFLTDGGREAIPVIRELTTRWPGLPVLVRAPHDDPHLRIGLSRLGARGLIATNAPLDGLMAAIERLLDGGTAFTPIPPGTLLLTSRDLAILQGLGDGLLHKQVADHLQTSRTAIDNRLSRLRQRFDASGTPGLVALVLARGLAHLPPELLSEVTDNGVTGGWADGRMGGWAEPMMSAWAD